MAKIKLKKKTSDIQFAEESDKQYILRTTTVVDSDLDLQPDEEEVTSLGNLRIMRNGLQVDSRAFRSGLMRLEENAGGFSNVDEQTQDELARRFATDIANVYAKFPNVWQRITNGFSDFHSPMVEARKDRFRWCASVIYNTVIPSIAAVVIGKIITNGFWTLYVEFGVEGTTEGDGVCLFDYVNSVALTPFEFSGLLEDITGNMIPNTIVENECITRINDCLRSGVMYGINE